MESDSDSLPGGDEDHEKESVLADRRAMAADRAVFADRHTREGSGRRSPRDQRHRARSEKRLPMVRLPAGIRPADDDLQPVRTVGTAGRVGKAVP